MTIKELVELACEKSSHFAFKVKWYKQRDTPRKVIDLDWLMPQLEEILGKEFVENAAQEELERKEKEVDTLVDSMIRGDLHGQTNEVQA